MQTLQLGPTELPGEVWGRFARRSASPDHFDNLVTDPTLIYAGDELVGVYEPLELDTAPLARALVTARPSTPHARTSGLLARSCPFGYRPRLVARGRDWCGGFAFNAEHPALYAKLVGLAGLCSARYAFYRPDLWGAQVAGLDAEVLPEYRLWPRSPFTSGIVNYESALAYHRDSGNFGGTWNAMVTLRGDTAGGVLVVPGWRVGFAAGDGALVLFDAQVNTHGVTPITRRKRTGYRVSVVLYALAQLRACLPCEDELAQAAVKRTEREQRRAGLVP